MTSLRHRIATDTRYVLLGLPTAVIAFVLVVTGISAGAGSLVAFVGLPVLAATAAMARNFADVERVLLPEVLGRRLARPRYPQAPDGAGRLRRAVNPLAGGQAWLDLLHAIIAFPVAIAAFVVTATWWAGAIAGLTFPLYGWMIAGIPDFHGGLPELLGLSNDTTTFVVFNTVLGVLFALTLVPVVRGAALIKANLAQALLTRPVYDEYPARTSVYRAMAEV
ncbi:sensor domain-containing protein [Nonomuraea rhizosphaerae]|uniref:sensor domain-containing protein n=1 Tax=Nonomuraea rhizosphaerae TaxID=2665663 RepID=UPI001C5EAD18|nr:sensor domain-containing protein [Nonomuraea rhizosphaerae]